MIAQSSVSYDFPVIHRSLTFTSVPMKVLRSGTIPVARDVPNGTARRSFSIWLPLLIQFQRFFHFLQDIDQPVPKHSCNQTIARAS